MFTIDFFAAVGAIPVESRQVDAVIVGDAVRQAEAMLADTTAAGPGGGQPIIGYVITDHAERRCPQHLRKAPALNPLRLTAAAPHPRQRPLPGTWTGRGGPRPLLSFGRKTIGATE